MRTIIKTIVLVFLSVVFVNCSETNTSSTIQIHFQSKGVSASSINKTDIDIIIINVSGPGMETIVSHNNCGGDDDCSTISVKDVPSGSDRLIQMLIVTKEGTTSLSNALFYGDSTSDISGNTPVAINLKQEDNFSDEADVRGQYIPSSTHALAGKELSGAVEVRVSIAGKPTMTLGTTEIMGGWFDFFLLDKVKFKYFFTGWDFSKTKYKNVEIFNDVHDGSGMNVNTISSLATLLNNKVVSFKPSSVTYVRENRKDDHYELRRLEQKIIAFLGASQKHACYDTGAVINFDGATGSEICTDPDTTQGDANTCSSFLSWSDLEKSLAPASAACDSPADSGQWEVDTKNLNDKDLFAGFHGLFTNGGQPGNLVIDYTLANRTFSWKVDPKVSVNGVHVLTKSSSSFDREKFKTKDIGDGFDCKKAVASGDFNSPVSAQINPTTGDYEHQITVAQDTNKSNDQFYMLLCPLAPDGTYYDSAYLYDSSHHIPPPNMKLALYDSAGTAVSGYGFNGSGWNSSIPYVLPPTFLSSNSFFFVEIKNDSPEIVTLNSYGIKFNHPDSGLTVLDSSISPPSSPECGSVSSLNPSDKCVVKVNFNPTGVDQQTYHDRFTLDFVGSQSNNGHIEFNFISPVYREHFYSNSGNYTLTLNANPNDKYDVHYVKLRNDSGGTWPLINFVNTANATVDKTGCPDPLPNGNDCMIKIEYLHTTSDSFNSGTIIMSNTGPSILTIETDPGEISLSEGNPFDFGQITAALGSSTRRFTITNNAVSNLSFEDINVMGNANFTFADVDCNSPLFFITNATCDFDIIATNPGSGLPLTNERAHVPLLYRIGLNTQRGFEKVVEADFVP